MLSPQEKQEIREEVHHELAEIEYEVAHYAGSYNYLCAAGGITFFAHTPVGAVLRYIEHVDDQGVLRAS